MYIQHEGALKQETLPLFQFLFPLEHMERPALQNKRFAVLRVAFRTRKFIGTFEQRAPGPHHIVEKTEMELPEVVLFL